MDYGSVLQGIIDRCRTVVGASYGSGPQAESMLDQFRQHLDSADVIRVRKDLPVALLLPFDELVSCVNAPESQCAVNLVNRLTELANRLELHIGSYEPPQLENGHSDRLAAMPEDRFLQWQFPKELLPRLDDFLQWQTELSEVLPDIPNGGGAVCDASLFAELGRLSRQARSIADLLFVASDAIRSKASDLALDIATRLGHPDDCARLGYGKRMASEMALEALPVWLESLGNILKEAVRRRGLIECDEQRGHPQ